MITSIKQSGPVRDAYLKLVRQFPLVSIESDKELSEAQEMLDSLLRRDKLDEGAQAYFNALSDLIVLYESEHVVIEHPGDAEILKHLIEARGITQTRLAKETGIGKSTISEILAGKRKLTRKQIASLSQYFHVAQGAFEFPVD